MEKGVLYVATGERYQRECCISVESIKKNVGDIDITVFTNKEFECEFIDNIRSINDPSHSSSDVIRYLLNTPYDKTIFFDTDIYVEEDITGIYDILGGHDLTVVHDTRHSVHQECPTSDVPSDYPVFNTGVIGYRKNSNTMRFFNEWLRLFKDETDRVIDQPSFRAALYHSNLNTVTLPPEYNCLYAANPGYLHGKVKIFHGRLTNVDGYKGQEYTYHPERVREKLNATEQPRVFLPHRGFEVISWPKTPYERFYSSLKKNGVIKTIYLTAKKISDKIN